MLNLSFYITLLLLSLNQLVSVSKGGGLNIYLFDIGVIFFSVFGLFYFLIIKKSFKLPKYSILFLLFCFVALASLLLAIQGLSNEEVLISSFYLFRFAFYLISGIVVFNMVDKKLISREKIFYCFLYSGVLIAFLGFLQLLILPDFRLLDPSLGWDPHKNRLASTFFDPNFVGAYFTVCLIMLLEKFYPRKEASGVLKKIKRSDRDHLNKRDLVLFVILLVGLFLTFSRSAWGMFAVVVLLYGFFRSRSLLYWAFLVVFLTYFAIPRIQTRISGITDPADSASLRFVSWSNTVEIIKDNFWFGVGFNTLRYSQRDYGFLTPGNQDIHSGAGSDSSILFVFATTGILGFINYVFAVLFPIIDRFFNKRAGFLIIFSLILGFLLESQFINSLFYPQIMFFFFCILFVYGVREMDKI